MVWFYLIPNDDKLAKEQGQWWKWHESSKSWEDKAWLTDKSQPQNRVPQNTSMRELCSFLWLYSPIMTHEIKSLPVKRGRVSILLVHKVLYFAKRDCFCNSNMWHFHFQMNNFIVATKVCPLPNLKTSHDYH